MDESQHNTAGAADLGFELQEFGQFPSAVPRATQRPFVLAFWFVFLIGVTCVLFGKLKIHSLNAFKYMPKLFFLQ